MTLDKQYVCQRAASAIISEIGAYKISTDALQAINQFLDEFIVLIITCSLSLDLSKIKSVVISLLSSMIGKNAIVEAELEVKTFTETESIDYNLYERMRRLGEKERFPLDDAVRLLREKCFEFCTLADKTNQSNLKNEPTGTLVKVEIPPIVAIYVTTIIEHITEYLLTAVAMTVEHDDLDHVTVKQVFLALNDDVQLGAVFNRMDLKDRLERKIGLFDTNRVSTTSMPLPQVPKNEIGTFLDIQFDDLDLEYFDNDDTPRKSVISTTPKPAIPSRPHSAMSQHNSKRNTTFHLFKNHNGNDTSLYRTPTDGGSDLPYMNFEDLIKSGDTVKVSLTPNRLKSIETKKITPISQPTWERRSATLPRTSTNNNNDSTFKRNSQKSIDNISKTLPPPRTRHSAPLSSIFNVGSPSSSPVNSTLTDSQQKQKVYIASPTSLEISQPSNLVKSTYNPQNASTMPSILKTTTTQTTAINTLTNDNRKSSSSQTVKNSTHVENTSKSSSLKSRSSTSSIPSTDSSIINTPQSILSTSLASVSSLPSSDNITPVKSTSTTSISIQEPPIPRPTKSNSSVNKNGTILRRGSGSSRKSRENLRKLKEEQEKQQQLLMDEDPIPSKINLQNKKSDTNDQPHQSDTLTFVLPSKIEANGNLKNNNTLISTQVIPREKNSQDTIPTRPSSMVAKRVSRLGNNRPKSFHEAYATEKYHQEILQQLTDTKEGIIEGNISLDNVTMNVTKSADIDPIITTESIESIVTSTTELSIDTNVKQLETLKRKVDPTPDFAKITTSVAQRRSVLSQLIDKQNQMKQKTKQEAERQKTFAVLDKVLKFERASTMMDHQSVAQLPRRERFLYLQQEPSAIERKTIVKPIVRRVIGIDQGVQTGENDTYQSIIVQNDDDSSEQGQVDGDEEWFLPETEWDDQEEIAITEWLLGE